MLWAGEAGGTPPQDQVEPFPERSAHRPLRLSKQENAGRHVLSQRADFGAPGFRCQLKLVVFSRKL